MNNPRGMVREIHPSRQTINRLDRLFAERCRCIRTLIRFHNDWEHKVQIFLDVRSKRQKRIQYFYLRVLTFVSDLTIEYFQHQRKDCWQEWLEFCIERLPKGFDQADTGCLQSDVIPKTGHEREDLWGITTDMILDDADEDGKLLEVELLDPSGSRGTRHCSKSRDDLRSKCQWSNDCDDSSVGPYLWQERHTFQTLRLED